MSDSPSRFSLRSVTGNLGPHPSAPPVRANGGTSEQVSTSAPDGYLDVLDPSDPHAETLPPKRGSGNSVWRSGPPPISLPSVPAARTVEPGPATGGIGVTWHYLDEEPRALPAATRPPVTVQGSTPPSVAVVETLPSLPATIEAPEASISIADLASATGARKRRRWQWWDVVVGTLVLLLVSYLLLAGGLYASRLWQSRHTNSVTLLQAIGHGGLSQVTVVFAHNHLMVTEIDNDDPTRVTVLQVNEAIVLSTDKTVLEAWFQAVLQPDRLDLVMQLDGGLDPLPYHPQFTTILINNVAAIQKDPHAAGMRAPTNAELQQALQKLST